MGSDFCEILDALTWYISYVSKALSPPLLGGSLHACTGRALEWHSRGQRFDPAYLHQNNHTFRCGYFLLSGRACASALCQAFARRAKTLAAAQKRRRTEGRHLSPDQCGISGKKPWNFGFQGFLSAQASVSRSGTACPAPLRRERAEGACVRSSTRCESARPDTSPPHRAPAPPSGSTSQSPPGSHPGRGNDTPQSGRPDRRSERSPGRCPA